MPSPINKRRIEGLPEVTRKQLVNARRTRKWTQKRLADHVGMVQMHISEIETGKVSPRFTTMLEIARALDYDLILVPRTLIPAVQSMIREKARSSDPLRPSEEDQPLYASEQEQDDEE